MISSYTRKIFLALWIASAVPVLVFAAAGTSIYGYLIAFTVAVFLFLLLAWWISRLILNPLKEIGGFVQKIGSGTFGPPIKLYGSLQLEKTAAELNQMSDELRKTLSEMSKDKKELQAILANMLEGVVVIGEDQRVRLLSAPTLEILDLRAGQAEGRPYWEIIRNEKVNAAIKDVFRNKVVIRQDLTTIFPKEQHFSMRVSPVLGTRDVILGVAAVFYDITELKRLENIRSEFVANVSHELKTPLTSIKGFVETLQSGAINEQGKAEKFLKIIKGHTERLESLVNDILSLSALESREFKLQRKNFNLRELIQSALALHNEEARSKKQRISFAEEGNIPELFIDGKKIEQVFSNLLANAIKYTPEQGEITISLKEDGAYIRVDVKDTGIGIPSSHLPRIFERFYRVDQDRSRAVGGTGLGLSIVKHIVQAHNGKVAVQSEPLHGSVFSIFLPKSS